LKQARPHPPVRRNLLLVDDSLSIRKVVGMFLSKAGYNCAEWRWMAWMPWKNWTGAPALIVIVTDLEMPRMHGYELLAEIRSRPAMSRVPGDRADLPRRRQTCSKKPGNWALNDYIIKPVDEETLVTSVKTLLAR
jgi:chemosensory pili system protein ChpA (sensor histidine kinase/response regulator)